MIGTREDNGLPRGWVRATIGQLIAGDGLFVDGDWVESKDQDPNGDVRLIQLADVGDGEYRDKSNRFMTSAKAKTLGCTYLKPHDILIARMPDPLGRSCLFPGDSKPSVTVVDVCIVRTGNLGANHGWLMYAINSPLFRANIASLQSGSTRKRISRGNLATLDMPVPPLPEQQRIVAKIEELLTRLDAGVKALQAVKAQLKRYRQSVLKSAFEGKLTAEWREPHKSELEPAWVLLERIKEERKKKLGNKYKESPPVDASELPKLPRAWWWATVSQIGTVQLGRQRSPKNRSNIYPTKYIRAANITEQGIDLSDVLEMEFRPEEKAIFLLKAGDLVLSEASGSPSQVGKPAIWNDQIPDCCFQNTVVRLRPSLISSEYLLVVFKHCYYNGVFSRLAAGVGINHLSAGKFSTLPIPIPSLEEQIAVASEVERCISIAHAIETAIEQSLAHSERLRQSILKQAFEGKLVPQDPNDEPADKLLERIQAERLTQVSRNAKHTRTKTFVKS